MDRFKDLQKFLEETITLNQKMKLVGDALHDIKPDDTETIVNIEKMLEMASERVEEASESIKTMRTNLVERNFIKSTNSFPQINLLCVDDTRKRDSGIESASSMSSVSPQVSANRLSGLDDINSEATGKVSFNLMSAQTSLSDFGEITEDPEESDPVNPSELSTLYIHLLPSDPNTDLSGLQEEIYNISRATVKSNNIQLHVVPSNSFIGIPSRHTSISSDGHFSVLRQTSTSSERLYSGRNRLPSSNDSLMALINLNNLSTKTPAEHSDLSDENNSRQVSSTDSDISMARYRLHLIHTETQTDDLIRDSLTASCLIQLRSVETQTD